MEVNKVYVVDALAGVGALPDRSVQCCVTSPPYYRQRDYGVDGQWGQEGSPEEYVGHLVRLFGEVRRVLKDDGTVWIVLGDSYAADKRGGRIPGEGGRKQAECGPPVGLHPGCKRKDLLCVPWLTALALRQDGWYLRQDIIWFKRNPMPESVTDRCTRSHEYIFMFAKQSCYYYDHLAIATPISENSVARLKQDVQGQKGSGRVPGKKNGTMKAVSTRPDLKQDGHGVRHRGFNARWQAREAADPVRMANRKSVWSIGTSASKEDHFASFPMTIPDLCIKASTREGDLVIDPFAGTGTTLLQASILGRKYIGFDLNPKYVAIAQRRLKKLEGLFYRG